MALARTGFTLEIAPIATLHPHEETIEAHVDGVADQVGRDSVQRDPILVDAESRVVLDGMHRMAAFTKLKIERAVCCLVDYSSESVSLSRWARVYAAGDSDPLEALASVLGPLRRRKRPEAMAALEARECGVAGFSDDWGYLPQRGLGLDDTFVALRRLDLVAEKNGWERSFVPEEELRDPGHGLAVLVEKLNKADVLAAGRSGELFPCKTSMHALDPRPVAINFPVKDLNSASAAALMEKVPSSGGRLSPANFMYEGRRYKERLLFLDSD
ncbi:MAG: hypothetical protein HY297_04670 [Thaumarchaeota archaeon]|nr:hypothetical protein [Nitrososphaerota archaeon]